MRHRMVNVTGWLVAALLVVSAAACGGGDNKSESKAATQAPAQGAAAQPSAQGAATQAPAPASGAQATTTQPAGGQSASASDLKKFAENFSKVKSFRARITEEQAGKQTVEGLMEVVRPDRLHFSFSPAPGQSFEVITIGNDTYTKLGTTWTKTSNSGGGGIEEIFKPSEIDASVQELASTGVTKGGTDSVDGKKCQIYTIQAKDSGGTPQEMCLATDSGLPLRFVSQSGGAKTTIIFSDYNANIEIKAPI